MSKLKHFKLKNTSSSFQTSLLPSNMILFVFFILLSLYSKTIDTHWWSLGVLSKAFYDNRIQRSVQFNNNHDQDEGPNAIDNNRSPHFNVVDDRGGGYDGRPAAASPSYTNDAAFISAWCQLPGLSKGQQKLCVLYHDHMYGVGKGAQYGIHECQYQFRNDKWNCSVRANDETVFGPILKIPSRETAFTHAINSAGVVHAIARFCRQGILSSCSCGKTKRPRNLNKDWEWVGCGDNLKYAYKFATEFIDVRERELQKSGDISTDKSAPRLRYSRDRSGDLVRNKSPDYKDDTDDDNSDDNDIRQFKKTLVDKTGRRRKNKYAKSLMNLHNNEAGRRAVYYTSQMGCKCHGVSGSCDIKTCWLQLPPFRRIGQLLKSKYSEATKVKLNPSNNLEVMPKSLQTPIRTTHNRSTRLINGVGDKADHKYSGPTVKFKRRSNAWAPVNTINDLRIPTALDLVFLKKSPDFCKVDPKMEFTGTHDRVCAIHYSTAEDGGDLLSTTVFNGQRSFISPKKNYYHPPFQQPESGRPFGVNGLEDESFIKYAPSDIFGSNSIRNPNIPGSLRNIVAPSTFLKSLDSTGTNVNIHDALFNQLAGSTISKNKGYTSSSSFTHSVGPLDSIDETESGDVRKNVSVCGSLCCGRGHYTRTHTIKRRCHCKFRWCCEVKCSICLIQIKISYCN